MGGVGEWVKPAIFGRRGDAQPFVETEARKA